MFHNSNTGAYSNDGDLIFEWVIQYSAYEKAAVCSVLGRSFVFGNCPRAPLWAALRSNNRARTKIEILHEGTHRQLSQARFLRNNMARRIRCSPRRKD